MKSMYKLFVAIALSTSLLMVAASASAQVLVGYQQRIFEKWGDGSGVGCIDVVPCCDVTPMNPTATVDNRVAGQNNGPYFAEHKVRTAMVSNFYGFGTPGALNGDGPAWYGFYNSASGGVTLKQGRFTSIGSLMLVFPGGNLRRLTTMLQRTYFDHAFAPGNGIGTFMYTALGNTATNTPTFRNATTFTPYSSQAGKIAYAPGPNQFGGTRNVFHTQFSAGVDNGSVPGLANRFRFPVKLGPGVPFTPQSVVRRTTGSATFAVVTIPSTMATEMTASRYSVDQSSAAASFVSSQRAMTVSSPRISQPFSARACRIGGRWVAAQARSTSSVSAAPQMPVRRILALVTMATAMAGSADLST